MAIQIRWRRGTTVDHSTFTGAAGECTVDLDKDTLVVHDGATAAGFPLMREDLSNASTITAFAKTLLDDADAASALTTLGISSFTQEQLLTLSNIVALQNLLGISSVVPAGMVQHYAGSTAPTGWLVCDGSAVSRTTYATLFTAVGFTYGAGDGTTTFNLPDLRGEFIRGNDEGRGVDIGRTVGSSQAQNISHRHDTPAVQGGSSVSYSPLTLPYGSTGRTSVCGGGGGANIANKERGWSGPAEDIGDVRPRNISLLPCIKY